jgi:hypothetical protein
MLIPPGQTRLTEWAVLTGVFSLAMVADWEEPEQLRMVARGQANRLDWKHSAATLLQLYEEASASPKRQIVI